MTAGVQRQLTHTSGDFGPNSLEDMRYHVQGGVKQRQMEDKVESPVS